MTLCAKIMDSCACSLEGGHEGPHVCACEGSWSDDGTIHAWPEVYVGPPEGRQSYEDVMPLLRDLSEMLPLPGPAYNTGTERE